MMLLLLLQGCSTAPEVIKIKKSRELESENHYVNILSHGWHTGIALPADDLNRKIKDLKVRFPNALYYEIGWGDAGFYQADKITPGLALRALFYSSGTVVHIVGFRERPEVFFPESEVIRIRIDGNGYEGMLNFIESSFLKDLSGNIVSLKRGIYGDSQFYMAEGRYHAFNTCNTWTAKALASAGIDIWPGLKLTSSSVMDYIRAIH